MKYLFVMDYENFIGLDIASLFTEIQEKLQDKYSNALRIVVLNSDKFIDKDDDENSGKSKNYPDRIKKIICKFFYEQIFFIRLTKSGTQETDIEIQNVFTFFDKNFSFDSFVLASADKELIQFLISYTKQKEVTIFAHYSKISDTVKETIKNNKNINLVISECPSHRLVMNRKFQRAKNAVQTWFHVKEQDLRTPVLEDFVKNEGLRSSLLNFWLKNYKKYFGLKKEVFLHEYEEGAVIPVDAFKRYSLQLLATQETFQKHAERLNPWEFLLLLIYEEKIKKKWDGMITILA